MTQPLSFAPPLPEPGAQIFTLLERHRERYPYLDEELRRHQVLTAAISAHRREAEQALAAWRSSLALRWGCEVYALRALRAAQRLLDEPIGDISPLTPVTPGAERTPCGLLQEARRRAETLGALASGSPLVAEALARLLTASADLEAAIARCDACEAERRRTVTEERLMVRMLQHVSERTRQILASQAFESL